MITFGKYLAWKGLCGLINKNNIDAKTFKHFYGLKRYHKIIKGDIANIDEQELTDYTAKIIFMNLYYEMVDE